MGHPYASPTARPTADRASGQTYRFFPYRGGSMGGTLRRGDLLLVSPVDFAAVRPGDVVVFGSLDAGSDRPVVVHRVLGRTAAGLVTRGDACSAPDAWPVSAAHVLGRVGFVQREGRLRRVWGGRRGLLWAGGLRLWRWVKAAGRLPYRLLLASGLARRLWRPEIVPLHLHTDEGPLVKYVHGRRTVACWWPDEGRFWCCKPYDLVIEQPDLECPIVSRPELASE